MPLLSSSGPRYAASIPGLADPTSAGWLDALPGLYFHLILRGLDGKQIASTWVEMMFRKHISFSQKAMKLELSNSFFLCVGRHVGNMKGDLTTKV